MTGFFIFFLSLYAGLSVYFGVRLYLLFGVFLPVFLQNKLIFTLIIIFISQFYLVVRILFRNSTPPGGFYFFASSTLALYITMLAILFIFDALLLVSRLFPPAHGLISGHMGVVGLIYLLCAVLLLAYGFYNANTPRQTRYELAVDKDIPAMRVVYVSDIHVTDYTSISGLKRLVSEINGLKPDLVLFGGDVIDGDARPYAEKDIASIFRRIESRHGVYGVLGNHEYYGEGIDIALELLNASGIRMLRDEAAVIDGLNAVIIGRDDLGAHRFTGEPRKSLERLLEGADRSGLLLILDHQPQLAKEAAGESVDLQLSGHTHNGQVFPGNLLVKAIYDNPWGRKAYGKFSLIVSCGWGTWGPPVRSAGYSEIVVADIKAK